MVKEAYITESECIRELAHYDEEAYRKAVSLIINAGRIGASG